MKTLIFIILYIVGIISLGVYLYKKTKTETLAKSVGNFDLLVIAILSIIFPIVYLLSLIMIIIEKIGDKLCNKKKLEKQERRKK